MVSKVERIREVCGVLNRRNDILFKSPKIPSTTPKILIFFCGDTQDFCLNMAKYRDSARYQEWSFENTANLMAKHFPEKYILLIRPARRKILGDAVLNCFDNFVSGNEFGAPTFCPNYSSLLHLKMLLQSLSKEIPKESSKIINEGAISLMGFSKGCIVLNQFLYEFHYYQNMQEKNEELDQFISRIKEMWWLDGGHSGKRDTWITDKVILQSFIKMGIDVHVHVTPYQIKDNQRPWIRIEEQTFTDTLKKGGTNIQRVLHFENQPRKLEEHFRVLSVIKSVQ